MAAPYGTTFDFGAHDGSSKYTWNSGVRSIDMHPVLIHLSPTATVTFGLLAETTFDSASPEWLQRTLASIDADNAVTEAADYTYGDPNVPARVQQNVRHMRKTAQVSGKAMADKVFSAVADLKRDQIETKMLELRRDMNYALINSALVSTSEATATRFRGILSSLSGASNTTPGIGTLAETDVKDIMLYGVYLDGWDPDIIVMPPKLHSKFDTLFFGSGPAVRYVDATAKSIASHINVYDTPFGRVQTVMERGDYLTDDAGGDEGVMFALQRDMWQIGYYRRTWMEEPPRDGDRWRGVIQVEWGLKDLAGQAGYSLTGVGA